MPGDLLSTLHINWFNDHNCEINAINTNILQLRKKKQSG